MIRRIQSRAKRLSTAALIFGAMEVSMPARVMAVELPVANSTWVTSGAATRTQSNTTLTVNQVTAKAIFQWDSFNISADGKVIFNQPDSNSLALNRILDGKPSQILGTLTANGQIYLINQNGILFGSSSRVNVGGLVASSLNISDDIFNNGLLSATNQALPALKSLGNTATISVQPGAQLTTNAANQRILLAANVVDNAGSITANDGQVVLAAGDSVYVNASTDPTLRGLLVEVSGGDKNSQVLNTGTVTAERGNITAVGLAVNQNGRMTATTSVSANGSIRLLARGNATQTSSDTGEISWVAKQGGTLVLGQGSVTEVNPDAADATTAVGEQEQQLSRIDMVGQKVQLSGGSVVRAAGGQLTVVAASDPSKSRDTIDTDASASVHVDEGALIDVSGSSATASVTRNLVAVELRANELADSPLQRDGALRGKTVVVDARVGTSLADVSGTTALIGKDVLERTSKGGSVVFDSAGDVVVGKSATIDVSGGVVNYTGGIMQTTQLIKADGTTVDISKASKDVVYIGMINPSYKYVSDRWGVTRTILAPGIGKYEAGYSEGADAGSIQFMGSAMALNGNFIGQATAGLYQRSTDTRPLGGEFVVGVRNPVATSLSFRAPDITLTNRPVPVAVGGTGSLPAGTAVQLTTDFIDNGGFSRIKLASDAGINIAAQTPIDLAAGGSISLAAPSISINSNIVANGGNIAATAVSPATTPSVSGLKIGDGVTFDVSGVWTNDTLTPPAQTPTDLLALDAGSIALRQTMSNGVLQIGNNVSLLADGGAWLKQSGSITGGKGGSISIAEDGSAVGGNASQIMSFGSGLMVSAFGSQGALGGTFTLRAPRIYIDDRANWLAAQKVTSSTTRSDVLTLGSALFTDFGFAKFVLQADSNTMNADNASATLQVASGAHINLQPATMWIDSSDNTRDSGSSLKSFGARTVLSADMAKPASLTLTASSSALASSGWQGVNVAQNSVITGNAGSTVNINSADNLTFDGSVRLAGGNVNLSIGGVDTSSVGYLDRQLVVGQHATIDISGTVINTPNDLGLLKGSVLDGGAVKLSAGVGSVNVKAGSVIDVSGTQWQLDILAPGTSNYARRTVASTAGSLTVSAQESIALQGDLRAQGGEANGVRNTGGSLSVSLLRDPVPVRTGQAPFPTGPRIVELVQQGKATPANGVASVDVDLVKSSGIESLTLTATNQIAIDAGVDVTLGRSLVLDAPSLTVVGTGQSRLAADYLTAGAMSAPQTALPTATSGTGQLTLQANQLALRGNLVLNNQSKTTLIISGDISLQDNGLSGGARLNAGGDLVMAANRVTPATGSTYALNASGKTITFTQNGASAGVPLSVGGQLTVNAANIVQGGSLYAPYGSITLNASNNLQLLSGSMTSSSGNGSVSPYGRVDNGNTWVWGQSPSNASEISQSPQGQVTLNGNSVDMASGSVVDVSGGGDLLAYQYTPGTGGKQDVLANGYLANTYVIVPANAAGSVTYDPMMWSGSSLQPGQSVYLAQGSGVPAGVYQLLPARYALLPGAYLVSAVTGFQDLPVGSTTKTSDGATVVAGYYTFGADQNMAARTSGFAVRPGSYARTLAQYDDHLASAFFADKAEALNSDVSLPADAGSLTIIANQTLSALGQVRGKGAIGGENANVNIAAGTSLVVDSGVVTGGTNGTVHLSSSILQGWNVGSLLLGGVRTATEAIDVRNDSVVVNNGATLVADEVLLAAAKDVTVDSGAQVLTRSASNASLPLDAARLSAKQTLSLTGRNAGNASLLAISDLRYLEADRGLARNSTGAGAVMVKSGAQVATRGALLVDGAGSFSLAGSAINANGASWSLGASNVVVGGTTPVAGSLLVDESLKSILQTARAIAITSEHDLTLAQGGQLGNAATINLSLQADRIINGSANANSTFTAQTITLRGQNEQPGSLTAGSGTLSLNAGQINLGDQLMGLSGFGAVTLNASGLVTATGVGGISVAGNLNVNGAALTAHSGAQGVLAATGSINTSNASTTMPDADAQQIGGELSITAKDIVAAGRILAPSGVVKLNATQSLQLTDSVVIDVSGYQPELSAGGSGGGAIELVSGGGVSVAAGTLLDVSAGTGANAGSITVDSVGAATMAGQYLGQADATMSGGSFELRAHSLTDFSALNSSLEAGDFTERRAVQIDTGDMTLANGDQITARQIELVADAGSININGTLLAASTDRRSSIEINAHNDVNVGASAVINASAADVTTQKAGGILINSTTGKLQLANGASIEATGKDQSGSLTLRAAATGTDFSNLVSLPTNLSKVDAVYLEPIKSGGIYTLSSDFLDASQFSLIRNDLASYVAAARTPTLNRLSVGNVSNVFFRPLADIVRTGDLTIDSYDFAEDNWLFNGQAATVSIRATGNLAVAGTLSDGFVLSQPNNYGLDLVNTHSVGLNLVAGANLDSASHLATVRNGDADLIVADYSIVRTGTGDINLSAARDVVIGNAASVYVGGKAVTDSKGKSVMLEDDSGFAIAFADHGGSVNVNAGRDVIGSVVNQSVTEWNIHWAPYKADFSGTESSAYWGVDYSRFGFNVGALGGGDISVRAGRDVEDASLATVDSAVKVNGARTEFGGGNIDVSAGNNIDSGYFYVAKGRGDFNALGEFGASGNRVGLGRDLGTFLLAGDSRYSLTATRDVLFEGIAQASLIDSTQFFSTYPYESFVWFSRYVKNSALNISSQGGDVQFNTGGGLVQTGAYGFFANNTLVKPFPASLRLQAFGGDVDMLDTPILSPSTSGSLVVYAANDVIGNKNGFTMSDVDTSLAGLSATNVGADGADGVASLLADNTGVVQHAADGVSSSVAAGRDITDLTLKLAEAVQVKAARDIVNLTLESQQSGVVTTSLIEAGRDFGYTADNATRQISLGGSGLLFVRAGRNIDLGITGGIVTTGNLLNGNLPDAPGADVVAIAGARQMAIDDFIKDVVAPSKDLQANLIAYIEAQTSRTGLSYDAALQKFNELNDAKQNDFVVKTLFAELVVSGHEANEDSSKGFARGYAALESLFPDESGNAYNGNISLPFSRVYTLDGGSISLLAPGGKIDVGLANAPTTLAVGDSAVVKNRLPSELGIVTQQAGDVHVFAQGDVLVNSSRIFTLGGGDIAIWSSAGNIDAGKGAKSSLSAPPPTLTIDAQGNVSINVGAAVAGSGIRTIVTSDDVQAGDVDLMAPAGFVNAGDAGIGSSGNLNIAAQKVVGLDNIQVGGSATGVPPETSGLGASLSGVTTSAGGAANSASNAAASGEADNKKQTAAPLAESALSWLEVFVVGIGEENCKQDDLECLKRQSGK